MLIFSARRSNLLTVLSQFFSTAMKSRKEIERANVEVHRDVGDHVQKIRETFASLFSLQRGKTVAR